MKNDATIMYIGGPTALVEWAGLRFLTDPTFDAPGAEYKSGPAILRKLAGPAVPAESLGRVDVVLLSHDHHFDNLDYSGRELLAQAGRVVTTPDGANRLGGNAIGLANWLSTNIPIPAGGEFTVTGTPCRHGPAGMDRGPVTGFVLTFADSPDKPVYVSGDTVWYEGVAEVANRFAIRTAVLFMGGARVLEVTPSPLTMTAADGINAARAFAHAKIVPLHYEGWAHFSESREVISAAFKAAELQDRLRWLPPGEKVALND